MNRTGVNKISPIFIALVLAAVLGAVLCVVAGEINILSPGIMVTAGAILLVFAGWAVTLCLHEFGHAFVAYRGGDWAVQHKGYLTLDPRRYTDPVLSILLPLLFVAIGGIPLPGGAVWINHHALRSRGIESSVSLAGPGTNLIVGAILAVITAVTGLATDALTVNRSAIGTTVAFLALLQIIAFVLNILPIPGLDGWGIIEPWLSPQAQRFGAQVRPYAPLALFVIIIAIPGAGGLLYNVGGYILEAFGGSQISAILGQQLALPWLS